MGKKDFNLSKKVQGLMVRTGIVNAVKRFKHQALDVRTSLAGFKLAIAGIYSCVKNPRTLALIFLSLLLIFTSAMPAEVAAFKAASARPAVSYAGPLNSAAQSREDHLSKYLRDDGTAKLDGSAELVKLDNEAPPSNNLASNNKILNETSANSSIKTQDKNPDENHSSPSTEHQIAYEDESKRTLHSSVYINNDGTRTLRYSSTQRNYEEAGQMKAIDNTLTPEQTETPKRSFWEVVTFRKRTAPEPKKFNGQAGVIDAEMQPFLDGNKISVDGKTIYIKPQGARNKWPERKDDRTVIYKDVWPGVDVEYELRGEMVKEIIIIKDKRAPARFDFKVDGGKIINHPTRAGELAISNIDAEKYSFSPLTLDVNGRGVIDEPRVKQLPTDDGMRVELDEAWLRDLPDDALPLRIDPSFYRHNTNNGGVFKSNGYACTPANCYYNTGTINDNGWKHWRSYFNFDYNQLRGGKRLLHARLQLPMIRGVNGDESSRRINVGWAHCFSFNCVGRGHVSSAQAGLVADIDFTKTLQWLLDSNEFGASFGIWGEEGPYKSYKPFYDMHIDVVYDTPTPAAGLVSPADKQVLVDTQPTLKANSVKDADGEAVKYRFRVSSDPSGGGAVISSGWQNNTKWSVPDGVLQDGVTYYWRVDTKGISNTGTETLGKTVRSFKVDLRKGKNSSQVYDTVGPIGVDLATGNASTSESTHSMSGLGGDIGLTLNYDTTASSNKGLIGKYWNINSKTADTDKIPERAPAMQRNDKEIDFNWESTHPGGAVANDWFMAQWQGYFIPPKTGEYTFGTKNDDVAQVRISDKA